MSNAQQAKLKKMLRTLNYIIDALGEFSGKYDKKFNLSRLLEHLQISQKEISDIISVILNFQVKFNTVFKNHFLKVKIENGQVYLFTINKNLIKLENIPDLSETSNEIILSKEYANLLKDLIYTFKRVKRGKGFDLRKKEDELTHRIKVLKAEHPYFFYKNGNGLVYPSELAIECGTTLTTYAKTNKDLDSYSVLDYTIKIC